MIPFVGHSMYFAKEWLQITMMAIKRLTSCENYARWRFAFKTYLKYEEL